MTETQGGEPRVASELRGAFAVPVRAGTAVDAGDDLRAEGVQDGVLEEPQHGLHLQRQVPEFGHSGPHARGGGDDADRFDGGQVDGDAGEGVGDAPAGEGVLVGACGGIVGFAGVAEDAGDGGEDDEEVEVGCVRELGVQVPGAGDFGEGGGCVVVDGHSLEDRVLGTITELDGAF